MLPGKKMVSKTTNKAKLEIIWTKDSIFYFPIKVFLKFKMYTPMPYLTQ